MSPTSEHRTDTGGGFFVWLIGPLLVVVTLLCAVILCVALCNLVCSSSEIENLLGEAQVQIASQDLSGDKMAPWATALCTRLRYRASETLNASTITFLFQIFSIGLVGAGVFLLKQYRSKLAFIDQRVREHRRAARHVAPFHQARSHAARLMAETANAHAMLSLCRAVKISPEGVTFAVARARDAARYVATILAQDYVDLSQAESDCLYNFTRHCIKYVDWLTKRSDNRAAWRKQLLDIRQDLKMIRTLLENGKHVDRYNTLIEGLSCIPGSDSQTTVDDISIL